MRTLCRWALGMTLLAAFSSVGWADASKGPPTPPPTPPVINFIVIEVKDCFGGITYEGIQYSSLKDRIKRAHTDFLAAEKTWEKAKADAAKAGTKFDKPKPTEGYVHRIGETTVYKTQAEASEVAKKKTDDKAAADKAAADKAAGK